MASYDPLRNVLFEFNKDRIEISDIYNDTKYEFRTIQKELLSPFGQSRDVFARKIKSVRNAFLDAAEMNQLDMATSEPAILFMSREKQPLVPWILGYEYLSSEWTDRVCSTVYKTADDARQKDSISIHEFGDIEQIVMVEMNEYGEPVSDWPTHADGERNQSMMVVRSSACEILRSGLVVVEVYNSDLNTAKTAMEKYGIVPILIVYSLDAAEVDSPEMELGPLMSLSEHAESVFYTIDSDRMTSQQLDNFAHRMSELENFGRLYTFPYTGDNIGDKQRLLQDMTCFLKNRLEELGRTACNLLIQVNRRCIDLFLNQAQKMYHRSETMTLEEVYAMIEENETEFRTLCQQQLKKLIAIFKDPEREDSAHIFNIFRKTLLSLTEDEPIDELLCPPVLDYVWAQSYCCQRKKRCQEKFDLVFCEIVRNVMRDYKVGTPTDFSSLGDEARTKIYCDIARVVSNRLEAFHSEFNRDIEDSYLTTQIIGNITDARRSHLRDLAEMVAVNELFAQSILDGPAFSDLQEDVLIKRGGQGSIHKLVRRKAVECGRELVVKKVKFQKINLQQLAIELHYSRMFEHDHIIEILGTDVRDDELCILMPRMEDLMDYCQRKKLSVKQKLRLAMQVASAVKYLHDMNIFHRDIKWQNVLVDGKGNAKLTDFGNCLPEGLSQHSECGTPYYMAPEIWTGHYDKSVDIYAFGLLLWTLIEEKNPILPNMMNRNLDKRQFMDEFANWTLPKPSACTESYWSVIQACRLEAIQRPSIDELIKLLKNLMDEF